MKAFSAETVYALRALLYLAGRRDGESYLSIRKISEELEISFHFLTKILQMLTQEGILTSSRGPAGGVRFFREPDKVSVIEVIHLFEGNDYFTTCMMGLPGCSDKAPCPVHDLWKEVRTAMKSRLEDVTLAEMGTRTMLERLRLSP
ncbi:MAG: Rrf2 family transcriptional regulator [Saprospirales bacterium]|nr:Rrf2 family transcriptional regulator [Saprospirales bacterium]